MVTDPILITGCARSGTSMVAGIVNICGAFGGDLIGANKYNSKGMFENKVIRDQVIKPLLREHGYDPLGQYPLPDAHLMWGSRDLRGQILDIMHSQGWDGKSAWFYKGAKMCHFWPLMARDFPNAKWIIVRRQDQHIVRSCLKTGFMRAFDNEQGWQWWVDQHKKRFEEMGWELPVREVWPEKMMQNDYSEMQAVIEWLGLEWQDRKARDFIEPKLFGSK